MTNYAAIGYALLAADGMKMDNEKKEQLWKLMFSIMDETNEEKAERRFRDGK